MSKILSFLMSAVMIFSYLLGFGSIKTDGGYTVVRTDKLNSVLSLYAAQGICYDGENFYCSGAITAVNFTGLSKFDKEMNCLRVRTNAVPKEFTEKYGSNHIGGIDCANGIYTRPSRARLMESICIISSCSMTAKRSNIPGYIMMCRAST